MSNHVTSGLLCSIVMVVTRDQIPSSFTGLSQFIFCIIFGGLLFLSTTGLISFAISIDKSVRVREIWNENFHWLGPIYIAMGALGYVMMLSFQSAKMLGVIAIIAPILILRISQLQYLERTKDLVNKLKAALEDQVESSREINLLNADLLDVLADVIDLRDPYVLGHSQNVARNAKRIAQEMGLSSDQINAVFNAGLLHDLGKIGIPEEILQKPGVLTKEEFEKVKEHPVISAKLVENCHTLQHLVPIIRHHHERIDGTGYPDGLCGSEIPIESRIVALADVVEAMSSDRPYRDALQPKMIIEEVKKMSGEYLDPQVVEVFLKLVYSEEKLFFQNSATKVCEKINGNEMVDHPWIQHSVEQSLPI
jgi:putative nucleotidyltransferase with HDIG domain